MARIVASQIGRAMGGKRRRMGNDSGRRRRCPLTQQGRHRRPSFSLPLHLFPAVAPVGEGGEHWRNFGNLGVQLSTRRIKEKTSNAALQWAVAQFPTVVWLVLANVPPASLQGAKCSVDASHHSPTPLHFAARPKGGGGGQRRI